MFARLRHTTLSTLLLAALLVFAVGPGMALHVLGDAHHNTEAHHHHAFDMALDIDHLNDSGADHSCALDHDHDQSHAASLTIGCLSAPVSVAHIRFDATPISYPAEARRAPPLGPASSIDKPPRLIASA